MAMFHGGSRALDLGFIDRMLRQSRAHLENGYGSSRHIGLEGAQPVHFAGVRDIRTPRFVPPVPRSVPSARASPSEPYRPVAGQTP